MLLLAHSRHDVAECARKRFRVGIEVRLLSSLFPTRPAVLHCVRVGLLCKLQQPPPNKLKGLRRAALDGLQALYEPLGESALALVAEALPVAQGRFV